MNTTDDTPGAFERPVFIIPMFLAIQAPDQEEAERIASDVAIHTNGVMRQGNGDLFALRLCEASPTTEWDWNGNVDSLPHSLEGLTIDSGSDRSATALVHRLVEQDADKPAPVRLASILTSLTGWLHQRMALHPHASTKAAPGEEHTLDCDALLMHAFARAEAKSGAPDHPAWSDLRVALACAKGSHPGMYEQLVSIYRRHRAKPDSLPAELRDELALGNGFTVRDVVGEERRREDDSTDWGNHTPRGA